MCACHTFLLSTGSRASGSLVSDMNQYANESGKACPITTVQACVHRVSEPSRSGFIRILSAHRPARCRAKA